MMFLCLSVPKPAGVPGTEDCMTVWSSLPDVACREIPAKNRVTGLILLFFILKAELIQILYIGPF